MINLLIETSSERGIVAIVNESTSLFEQELPFGYSSSKELLPTIKKGIERCGIKISNLSNIVVGIGPGSYTGLRVGLATAQALSFPWGIPLIGLPSLHSFSPEKAGNFAVLIDAKVSGAYLAKGNFSEERGSSYSEPTVLPLNDLIEELQTTPLLLTPNCSRLKRELERLAPNQKWEWIECSPSVPQMIRAALKETPQKKLEILYLRKTQAEIEREGKKGF